MERVKELRERANEGRWRVPFFFFGKSASFAFLAASLSAMALSLWLSLSALSKFVKNFRSMLNSVSGCIDLASCFNWEDEQRWYWITDIDVRGTSPNAMHNFTKLSCISLALCSMSEYSTSASSNQLDSTSLSLPSSHWGISFVILSKSVFNCAMSFKSDWYATKISSKITLKARNFRNY